MSGYTAWSHQTAGRSSSAWSGWIAGLIGLWVLVSPFVLSGAIGAGAPLYSNLIAGIVVLVLAGWAAYEA